MEKIALLAGGNKFPIIFAKAARDKGNKVIAIAINGLTEPQLADYVEKIHWVDIGQIGKVFQILLFERLKKIILAGKIPKTAIFDKNVKKDDESLSILNSTNDRRTETLLTEVARRLNKIGIMLMDSTTFLKDNLVSKGVLTGREPDTQTWEDIRFGEQTAKEIARLDIGQTVIVKNKDIIAVEGIEGTDEAIKRAGTLVGPGTVVVKVARPNQDMRFDVPIVGIDTMKTLTLVKAKALAVEAGTTLLVDKEDVITNAVKENIVLVGI